MRDVTRELQSAIVVVLLVAGGAAAQTASRAAEGVSWQVRIEPQAAKAGEPAELVLQAAIAPGWILYSSDFEAAIGPRPARFSFDPTEAAALAGPIRAVEPLRRKDSTWHTEYTYFQRQAEFRQPVQIKARPATISGRIDAQACQEESGTCTLIHEQFSVRID